MGGWEGSQRSLNQMGQKNEMIRFFDNPDKPMCRVGELLKIPIRVLKKNRQEGHFTPFIEEKIPSPYIPFIKYRLSGGTKYQYNYINRCHFE